MALKWSGITTRQVAKSYFSISNRLTHMRGESCETVWLHLIESALAGIRAGRTGIPAVTTNAATAMPIRTV